jgi:hypothetical protein
MNILRNRCVALGSGAIALALALTQLNACAVEGVGVDGSVGVGYDAGYYEPYGYEYGGWGPGYRVGPGRGGDRRGGHPGSYRPAPSSRPTPSIPNRPRAGGGPRGGGGPHH